MKPPERIEDHRTRHSPNLRLVRSDPPEHRWTDPDGPFLGLQQVLEPGEHLLVGFEQPTTVQGVPGLSALNVRVEEDGEVTVVLISGLHRP